jgi:uncharacterized membrane protein YkvA (DUF1232 family)
MNRASGVARLANPASKAGQRIGACRAASIRHCIRDRTIHIGGIETSKRWRKAMKRILALWRVVGGHDVRLLWFALRHEGRPGWLLPALAGLALFAVEPLNFAVPVVGAVDELVLVPLVLHAMATMLPAHVLDGFSRTRTGPFRRR